MSRYGRNAAYYSYIDDTSEDPRYAYEDEDDERGEEDLVDRLERAGYSWCNFNQQWEKVFLRKIHICRRDHKDGTIKKGQRYIKVGTRICYPYGDSKQVFTKHVLDK